MNQTGHRIPVHAAAVPLFPWVIPRTGFGAVALPRTFHQAKQLRPMLRTQTPARNPRARYGILVYLAAIFQASGCQHAQRHALPAGPPIAGTHPSHAQPIELASAELPVDGPAMLPQPAVAETVPDLSEPPSTTEVMPQKIAPIAETGPVVRAAPVAQQVSAEQQEEEAVEAGAPADLIAPAPHTEPVPMMPSAEPVALPNVVEPFFAGSAGTAPRELSKMQLPAYRIEPPDILQIEAIYLGPKPDYRLRTLDSLLINVAGALEEAPISGEYVVEPGGGLNLGGPYGRVEVGGMTLVEADEAIEAHLANKLREPEADVSLGQVAASQQIAGPHLVGPDGTVTLGTYGSVSVVDLTISEAKLAIESHLGQFLEAPEISVDVFAYNSKVYYVITQGAGLGDTAARFPITGNETVLDALTLINGLNSTSSTKIWVARPDASGCSCHILPVDWCAITQCGAAGTNFQLMPGDRVYVAEDRLVAIDNHLAKFLSPFERILGFTALGTSTVSRLQFYKRAGGNFNNNIGF